MPIYIIGLGLSDEHDISLKGLKIIRECDLIYFENYTGILQVPLEKLEEFFQKKIRIANRKVVEESNEILDNAASCDVAFLVVGDPFSATTHYDLFMRARKKRIKIYVIHNTSILNAIGETGLHLYKFGAVASIPLPQKNFNPESFFDVLKKNQKNGFHTLLLLDMKPDEHKFLTIGEAIKLLLKINKKMKEKIFTEKTLIVGCARIGTEDRIIKSGTVKEISKINFGKAPYCIVVPGKLHFTEEEALKNLDDKL